MSGCGGPDGSIPALSLDDRLRYLVDMLVERSQQHVRLCSRTILDHRMAVPCLGVDAERDFISHVVVGVYLLAEHSLERPQLGIQRGYAVPDRGDIFRTHLLGIEVGAAPFYADSATFEYAGKGSARGGVRRCLWVGCALFGGHEVAFRIGERMDSGGGSSIVELVDLFR